MDNNEEKKVAAMEAGLPENEAENMVEDIEDEEEDIEEDLRDAPNYNADDED